MPFQITEDVDGDAQPREATVKDDLMLLAAGHDGAQWAEELAKLPKAAGTSCRKGSRQLSPRLSCLRLFEPQTVSLYTTSLAIL